MGPKYGPKIRNPTFWRKKKPLRERAKPDRARNLPFWDPFELFWHPFGPYKALWAHTRAL